jgi:LAS superfamily LD-carboxypeptidase LdcB
MAKHIEAGSPRQSLILTILFTTLSCLFWGLIFVNLIQGQIISFREDLPDDDITPTVFAVPSPSPRPSVGAPIPTKTLDASKDFAAVIARTAAIYDYELFLYPVSSINRLPIDYPRTEAQLPLVKMGEISIAAMIEEPLELLIMDAKSAGFSPYLRSGFRSINDQYTAFSRYVTEATSSGKSLAEAQAYARRFSAEPGYSEHHLGLAVDLLDYFYPDWIIARNNYDKGLYLWLQQHAHEYGFVISYPAGTDPTYAKSGSGYTLSEPWHLRFVGKELAIWLYEAGYLVPQIDLSVNEQLNQAYLLLGNIIPVQ